MVHATCSGGPSEGRFDAKQPEMSRSVHVLVVGSSADACRVCVWDMAMEQCDTVPSGARQDSSGIADRA